MAPGRSWGEAARDLFASFRVRLILLVLVAVLPALAFMIYSAAEQRLAAAEEARTDALRLERLAVAEHERLIEETRELLRVLGRMPEIRGGDRAVCDAFLDDLIPQYPRYNDIAVVRPDGFSACSAATVPASLNVSDRLYFRQAMETRDFTVGEYIVSRATGDPIVVVALPLLDGAGEVESVVVAALDLAWLSRFAARAELPTGGTLTLVDRGGTILSRYPDPERWVGRSFPDLPVLRAMQAGPPEGTVEGEGLDGVERLYVYRRMQPSPASAPIYLSIGASKALMFAGIDRALTRNLLLLGVVTTLALLAAWFGGNFLFLRRVRALVRATERIEAGDLSARTGLPAGRGELDRLAQTFDRTAGTLEERTVALQEREREAQEHLERIARLNRVYAVLSGINSALLRIQDADELLRQACRIAVEHGKFRLAQVHRVDQPGGELSVVARSASPEQESEAEPADGIGLARETLRSGKFVVRNDLGAHSAAAFPLRVEGEVAGVLSLYAPEPHFFDPEEIHLLRELAADTSLGLSYLEKERRLQYFANYDPLTDLPNRALFEDRLGQAIAQAKQDSAHVGVVSLAIENLEEFYAALGRSVGDRVVQEVVRQLEGAGREGDTIARLGNDEFGIVLAGLSDLEEIETLASQISDQAPDSITVEDQEVYLSVRTGVSVYPEDGDAAQPLIQNATLARRFAPRNAVAFFSADVNARVQERRTVERELRRAIERNELRVFYQPVVDVRRREVVGVEGLLRWHNETLGDVSPATFIPVAEESGLINPIGEWIVETALHQGIRWHSQGLDIRINVNVSVNQLSQAGFVDRITGLLASTGFDPRALALGIEITESELMENLDEAVAALRRFREMGMKIYIDDFGTGYSSLSYLRELPIDTLKIDASFVRDIPGDADAVAVVTGILAMARSLELRVIAEGVETEEQFAILREHGCDAVQGYLFGRPAPAEEVETLFGRRLAASASG